MSPRLKMVRLSPVDRLIDVRNLRASHEEALDEISRLRVAIGSMMVCGTIHEARARGRLALRGTDESL